MGGCFLVKKWKMGGVFCKKVDLSSTQDALCTVSVFLFYLLLTGGRIRTQRTPPPCLRACCYAKFLTHAKN